MKEIKFGKLKIGGRNPVIIVAEIADSHNGSVSTAKKMIKEAKKAGADVVKFQLHLPDVEMVPNSIKMWSGNLYKILKKNLFTPEMHKAMMNYCKKIGIEYLCTPFCPEAVDILDELGVKAFKTGSGELTNLPMHRKLAKISALKNKPVLVSTGMSTWKEVREAVKIYQEERAKENLILMNCTSEYPPNDYTHANLGLIQKLQKEFRVWVGQSDHTLDNYTAFAAVVLGTKVIEKHFTLDRRQKGPDHAIYLESQMLKDLVGGIRKIEVALGDEKQISKEEQVVRNWAAHSVVAGRDIKKGEKLTLQNLMPKRPGSGIPAKFLDKKYSSKLLVKKARCDLPKNTILKWNDIMI